MLEYRSSVGSRDDSIVTRSHAEQRAGRRLSLDQARSIVRDEASKFLPKSTFDSQVQSLLTPSQIQSSADSLLDKNSGYLTLGPDGQVDPAQLPDKYVEGMIVGGFSGRGTAVTISKGGRKEIARASISLPTSRNWLVLPYAHAEARALGDPPSTTTPALSVRLGSTAGSIYAMGWGRQGQGTAAQFGTVTALPMNPIPMSGGSKTFYIVADGTSFTTNHNVEYSGRWTELAILAFPTD